MKYIEWLCWSIVSVFAVTDCYWILLDLFEIWGWQEPDAGDWAAWVQAIGSIAAIGAAIFVMRKQNQHALDIVAETDRRAARRRAEAVQAIVDAAALQILGWTSVLESGRDPQGVVASITKDPAFLEAEKAISAIPLHDLGAYKLVVGIQHIAECFRDLRDLTQRLENVKDSDAYWIEATTQGRRIGRLAQSARTTFESGLETSSNWGIPE